MKSFPLYCTANGKAYLAALDDAAIESLIGREYQARTANTITNFERLIEDLKAVRETGIAIDREEHSLGICAAGVALRDPLGNFVAISVPVPAQRFLSQEKLIKERLLATKVALESHLMVAPV